VVEASYPVNLAAAVTGTAAAHGAAAGPGGPGGPGGAGGVTGAATQSSLSLVSFGLAGPLSSPPAPRPLDPVWQFECRSDLKDGHPLPGAASRAGSSIRR
jgi:hypothetical protein